VGWVEIFYGQQDQLSLNQIPVSLSLSLVSRYPSFNFSTKEKKKKLPYPISYSSIPLFPPSSTLLTYFNFIKLVIIACGRY
jgi:hypothetical protein